MYRQQPAEQENDLNALSYWLCWLAVLPGAVIGGILLTFPLHWVLYNTLANFIEPYPPLPERILSPMVIALGVVWVGARIAPARRIEAAVVLFGLWMMLLGATVAVALFGGNVAGRQFFFYGGGLGPVAAFVGSIIGLWIVRAETRTAAPEARNSKHANAGAAR